MLHAFSYPDSQILVCMYYLCEYTYVNVCTHMNHTRQIFGERILLLEVRIVLFSIEFANSLSFSQILFHTLCVFLCLAS